MQPGFSAITSSQYYHPSFNSAIFDGPMRIYFVQFHETFALKIYFALQDYFVDSLNQYKEMAKRGELTLLIMIYPTEEGLYKAFPQIDKSTSVKQLVHLKNKNEIVFGLLAPVLEQDVSQLMEELANIFKTWDRNALIELNPIDRDLPSENL